MKLKNVFKPVFYGLETEINKKLYYSSFAICLLMVVVLGLLWKWLPEKVPLYFNKPWGEERLDYNYMLFGLPLIGMIFSIFNLMLGKKLGKYSDTIVTTFAVTSASVNFMIFLGMVGILRSIL